MHKQVLTIKHHYTSPILQHKNSMSLGGGRHEIEAAKARLKAAQNRTSSASKMLKKANEMVVFAKTEFDTSNREEADAKKCLDETEKRWEVVERCNTLCLLS